MRGGLDTLFQLCRSVLGYVRFAEDGPGLSSCATSASSGETPHTLQGAWALKGSIYGYFTGLLSLV